MSVTEKQPNCIIQSEISNAHGFFMSLLTLQLSHGPQRMSWPAQTTTGLGFGQACTTWPSLPLFYCRHQPRVQSPASYYVNVPWCNIKVLMAKMKMLQLSNENKIDCLQRNDSQHCRSFIDNTGSKKTWKRYFQRPGRKLF